MARKKSRNVKPSEVKRMQTLYEKGMGVEKIAEVLDRDDRTVRKYLRIGDVETENQRQIRNIHIDTLKDQITSLRRCLEHPGIEYAVDRGPLMFRGRDWRIDPVRWFCLSTPDIESDDWKPYLEQLRSHTPEWPFWNHLEELKKNTNSLAKEIFEAGDEISRRNLAFKSLWDNVVKERTYLIYGSQYRPSRTNLHPEPELVDMEQTLENDMIELVIGEIESYLSEPLWEKQGALEEMLDQLTADFLDPRLNDWIVKGRCDGCPR
jgi:hypothetical protein